ncbi:MAG: VCBS repeat-containing protein, partial [Deltaproteobacteria bacterium]|nr:VCBS repeat-containing protein [Deltaproteobacteria bacterium]
MDFRPSLDRTTLLWLIGLGGVLAPYSSAQAIEPFIDQTATLQNPGLTSGVAIGITDMNGDGLDDLVRLDNTSALEVEFQQEDGSFVRLDYGLIGGSAWGMALADVNGDGNTDIFAGGAYDGLKLLTANADATDYESSLLPGPGVFVQCANFADIDNDGTLDLFVCNDDGISSPYTNDGNGSFSFDFALIAAESTIPSDNSGNYGSVWSDYDSDGDLDLYIAKCRLGVQDNLDGRRVNLLFQNDGEGNYTDVAEAAGLRPLAQSWTVDFGDIDNDGDMDAIIINHDLPSGIYENMGPADMGTFVDITAQTGIAG